MLRILKKFIMNKDYAMCMVKNSRGSIPTGFLIRLLGAAIGCAGFLFLVYQQTILGTGLIGIGSILIAFGET